MHRTPLGLRGADDGLEGRVRRARPNAHLRGEARHGRHRTGPDDVVDLIVVGIKSLRAGIQVQDGGEARLFQTEIIQPAAVLAELVAVGPVLGGRVHVTEEQRDPPFSFRSRPRHQVEQGLPPADIYAIFNHAVVVLCSKDKYTNKKRRFFDK